VAKGVNVMSHTVAENKCDRFSAKSLILTVATLRRKLSHLKMNNLSGSLSPRHGTSTGCGWRRRPTDMEGSANILKYYAVKG
jgi:hypothetical protein